MRELARGSSVPNILQICEIQTGMVRLDHQQSHSHRLLITNVAVSLGPRIKKPRTAINHRGCLVQVRYHGRRDAIACHVSTLLIAHHIRVEVIYQADNSGYRDDQIDLLIADDQ